MADASVMAKANAYLIGLKTELETSKTTTDAKAITFKESCSSLDQKLSLLQEEFLKMELKFVSNL